MNNLVKLALVVAALTTLYQWHTIAELRQEVQILEGVVDDPNRCKNESKFYAPQTPQASVSA